KWSTHSRSEDCRSSSGGDSARCGSTTSKAVPWLATKLGDSGRPEAPAVCPGRRVKPGCELRAHGDGGLVTGAARHPLDGLVGRFEQPSGEAQALGLQPLTGCESGGLSEPPRQRPWADRCTAGEIID